MASTIPNQPLMSGVYNPTVSLSEPAGGKMATSRDVTTAKSIEETTELKNKINEMGTIRSSYPIQMNHTRSSLNNAINDEINIFINAAAIIVARFSDDVIEQINTVFSNFGIMSLKNAQSNLKMIVAQNEGIMRNAEITLVNNNKVSEDMERSAILALTTSLVGIATNSLALYKSSENSLNQLSKDNNTKLSSNIDVLTKTEKELEQSKFKNNVLNDDEKSEILKEVEKRNYKDYNEQMENIVTSWDQNVISKATNTFKMYNKQAKTDKGILTIKDNKTVLNTKANEELSKEMDNNAKLSKEMGDKAKLLLNVAHEKLNTLNMRDDKQNIKIFDNDKYILLKEDGNNLILSVRTYNGQEVSTFQMGNVSDSENIAFKTTYTALMQNKVFLNENYESIQKLDNVNDPFGNILTKEALNKNIKDTKSLYLAAQIEHTGVKDIVDAAKNPKIDQVIDLQRQRNQRILDFSRLFLNILDNTMLSTGKIVYEKDMNNIQGANRELQTIMDIQSSIKATASSMSQSQADSIRGAWGQIINAFTDMILSIYRLLPASTQPRS